MMDLKVFVYAVVAVALGYLLISAVPDRLTALHRITQPGDAEESFAVEEAEIAGEESRTAPEEAKSAASGAKAAANDAKTAESVERTLATPGGFSDMAVALGVWVINLLIALGVYFVVKRQLS